MTVVSAVVTACDDTTRHTAGQPAVRGRGDFAFFGLMVLINSIIVAGLLVAHAALQGWWTSIVPRLYFEGFADSYFFSLACWLAVWAALFPGPHFKRNLAATLVLLMGGFCFAALHIALVHWLSPIWRPITPGQILRIAASQTALFVLLYAFLVVPLWWLRYVTRISVIRADQPVQATGRLRIKHLVISLTFLSCALAIANATIPAANRSNVASLAVGLCLFCLVCGAIYLWAVLGCRRLVFGLIVLVIASQLLWYVGSHLSIYFIPRYRPRDWFAIVIAFRGVQIATIAAALLNGLAARSMGYRLVAGAATASAIRHSA